MADFEGEPETLEVQPAKRKRSSILMRPEKRVSRDGRTVSFSDQFLYKELHADGTCDITNLLLRQDMDLTLMDIVDPTNVANERRESNQTKNSSMDISLVDDGSEMDLTLISQFVDTMPKVNSIDLPSVNYDSSTIYDRKMSLVSDISSISSLNSTLVNKSTTTNSNTDSGSCQIEQNNDISLQLSNDTTLTPRLDSSTILTNNCSLGRLSDISNLTQTTPTVGNISANETLFGAFHDSNNISISSRLSGVDTLVHNLDALNECVQQVDHESEGRLKRLHEEMEELFKFYRHIINNENKYEFAVSIFGLRYNLWLIINVNPETYPNEKLNLRFAVNKADRDLYPFREYAEAVRRHTKEGEYGYLSRFIFQAQKFRRFLRKIGYRKPNSNSNSNSNSSNNNNNISTN